VQSEEFAVTGMCRHVQFARQLNITGLLIDLKSITTNVLCILGMNGIYQRTTSGQENLKVSTRNRLE